MSYICDECGYVSDGAGLCPTCGIYLKEIDEDTDLLGSGDEDFGTASDINFLGDEDEEEFLSEEDWEEPLEEREEEDDLR